MKIAGYNGRCVTVEIEHGEAEMLAPLFKDLSEGVGPWNPEKMQDLAEFFEAYVVISATRKRGSPSTAKQLSFDFVT